MIIENLSALANLVGQVGVSAQQATKALENLSNSLKVSVRPLDELDRAQLYNGEVVFNPDTQTCYVYNEGNFIQINEEMAMKANYEEKIEKQPLNGNLNMNLYDLNKAAVTQLPNYNEADKQAAKELINTYDDFSIVTRYYMLLCRELNYYTVFQRQFTGPENFGDVVIECLENLGNIKSIEVTKDKTAIEAWIVNSDNEAHVVYLFNYDQGVVRCL